MPEREKLLFCNLIISQHFNHTFFFLPFHFDGNWKLNCVHEKKLTQKVTIISNKNDLIYILLIYHSQNNEWFAVTASLVYSYWNKIIHRTKFMPFSILVIMKFLMRLNLPEQNNFQNQVKLQSIIGSEFIRLCSLHQSQNRIQHFSFLDVIAFCAGRCRSNNRNINFQL